MDILSVPPADTGRPSPLPDLATRQKIRRKRKLKDDLSRWGISAAGFGVVLALTTIFVYLFYEVLPILRGATVERVAHYAPPVGGDLTQRLYIDRYETFGLQYTRDGTVNFFALGTGELHSAIPLDIPAGALPVSFAAAESISGVTAYGLNDGRALVAKHNYTYSFPNDVREITPRIEYPLGEAVVVDPEGQPLSLLAVEQAARGVQQTALAAYTADRRLLLTIVSTRTNMLTRQTTTTAVTYPLPSIPAEPVKLLLDKTLRSLFVIDDQGVIHYIDISSPGSARLIQSEPAGGIVTAAEFLVGTVSLIIGTEEGELSQWFLVRENNEETLTRVREFRAHNSAITDIEPEYTRKGFIAADAAGGIGIHYGTSTRTLYLEPFVDQAIEQVAVSQLNGKLLVLDAAGQLHVADVWNEHPQLSFAALWNKVWYEGRDKPDYIWQSSSGSDEFESKFSLVPLSLGTLKAAFYAMLFAMPLAIAGAIYTAYFMTPKLRGVVKPTIEIMEALPTVILGFLAGLWLAPFTENNLPAIFSFLLLMPVMLLLFAFAWSKLPAGLRQWVPEGWEAAVLVPVIILFGVVCVWLSPWVEIWFFNGSMRQWLTDVGIVYDQRNALIVGIAMGFAVIPTIFSIAEDAVFTVPRHLTQGSLALGATRWQTVRGVVIPTASPGIFSAVMMGFGRAVGETMIVLMATGNSPVVNFNIFEGMRTLSANIAVELPETAVGSSHFRVLFLAALVLLVLTFLVNTIAEIIRQRLRLRYSNL